MPSQRGNPVGCFGAKIKRSPIMEDTNFDHPFQSREEDGQAVSSNDVEMQQNDNGQPQRLMITHIVNEFFKSYAGKQVLGPFHKVGYLESCHF